MKDAQLGALDTVLDPADGALAAGLAGKGLGGAVLDDAAAQDDGDLVRQSVDTWKTAFMTCNDVLNGSGNQEVFLFQAQFAAGFGRVVRIQDA